MILVIVLFILSIALYLYNIRTFDYWKKKGIKHDKPQLFFGTNTKVYLLKKSIAQLAEEMYRKYPEERVIGAFSSTTPELIIRDPELVKQILTTDSSHFMYRSFIHVHEDSKETLICNLFTMDGDIWRLLRQRLTPAFSSGKLKAMFPLIVERAERLHSRIHATAGAPIDSRDLMARFTTDFIGACAFGLDMDALSDENSKFRELGANIFKVNLKSAFKFFFKAAFPGIFKHVNFVSKNVADGVLTLVQIVLKQRNYEPSGRNDFIDLLLECKKKGKMMGESMTKFKADGTPEQAFLEMTDDLLAAQVFVFFSAGFETSSSTSSFTLHLLAYHPDKQRKVQEEIDRVLAQHDNKLCYEAVKEMTYLEWAFKESMRILPALGFLNRKCNKKYKFPDMDLTIDEGVKILIPVHSLQNDPKYFENPEEFRPERFDPKEWNSGKNKFVYLPFGEGPRACIGERLGLMQSLAGLAAVLSNFNVEPAPNSLRHPNVDTFPGLTQGIRAGLPLLFKERKKEQ